jgi:single-stranded-DNA-specific exonuclease
MFRLRLGLLWTVMQTATLKLAECPPDDVASLVGALAVSEVTAQVLVRRGLSDPVAAAAFLAAAERHDPDRFAGIEAILELILRHVAAGSQITVHGDYDVDGVCSTAVVVRALRRLGSRADWFLPDRFRDGYGLKDATVARLAARGTQLLITVDCGITSSGPVAAARAAGMDVIVTDHHTFTAADLPAAPIMHPVVSGYPCADLCATGVAFKLAQALAAATGVGPTDVEDDLDLVALATIADSVPLVGENRALTRAGLRALARTCKPGLRALMARAHVDPSRLDERAVSFGLAPRINAAGRLYHADAALELIMTEDEARAGQIAEELDRANSERRDAETRVLFEAEAQVAELPQRSGYVLAGEGWHAGVIGIVASRLVERHRRPFVLLALDGDVAKGSARSVGQFDLIGALDACRAHLRGYGGHRAAAGMEVDRGSVGAFAQAFDNHAAATLTAADLVEAVSVDAVAHGGQLSLDLAEELATLAPFGQGNPVVSLLVPGARGAEVRTMGEGRHLRFILHAHGARMNAVAFGAGGRSTTRGQLAGGGSLDAVLRLEVNEWRGMTEPRLNLVHVQPADPAFDTFGFADTVPYSVSDAQGRHTLAG